MTRQGRRCRNRAAANSSPPACRKHAGKSQVHAAAPDSLYFHSLTEKEKTLWAGQAVNNNLKAELALVRVVLARLLEHLNDPAYVLLPEDLRRLTGLIFTGARTVAQLLSQPHRPTNDTQVWLDQALSELSEKYPIDL